MDNNNLSALEDDYNPFMVYLRENGVWKVIVDLFKKLNETRPADPIEYIRANVKTDNSDSRLVEHMRREIAEAEEKIIILKRDKLALTASLDSVDERIRANGKKSSSRWGAEDNEMNAAETSFTDSTHA